MTYRKTLSDAGTRSPEQQRAMAAGARKPGQRPKEPSPDRMGLAPDQAAAERQGAAKRRDEGGG
jgi:hypothetical protein